MEVVLNDITCWDSPASGTANKLNNFLTSRNKSSNNIPKLRKKILDSVSIRFTPGSVTALHGYGGGSSILLSVISTQRQQQNTIGQLSGSILYDNSIRSAGAYCDIACCSNVPLDYLFDLTVSDYLFWAARLRVSVSEPECRYKYETIIDVSLLH